MRASLEFWLRVVLGSYALRVEKATKVHLTRLRRSPKFPHQQIGGSWGICFGGLDAMFVIPRFNDGPALSRLGVVVMGEHGPTERPVHMTRMGRREAIERVEHKRKAEGTRMGRRLAMLRKRRQRRATIGGVAASVVGAAIVFTVAFAGADNHEVNIEVADRTGFAEQTLDDGSIVQYIGDDNASFGSAGSGVFDSFVRVDGSPTESGYNTDGTREFDTKGGNFTHSILLSDIPMVTIDGQTYWEFFADINDSDNTSKISLDEFELYVTDDPNLSGYDFGTNATLVYDFEGAILINDVNQGSGRGDLRYLVAVDEDLAGDCFYGSTACDEYLVLYSAWGGYEDSAYQTDGGFEEWKVKKYPVLGVSKDIEGTFQQNIEWDLTKTEDGTYEAWAGETIQDHPFSVDADPTLGPPSSVTVSGTITLTGDPAEDLTVSLSDVFDGQEATLIDCDPTVIVEAGTTTTCDYQLDLDEVQAGTNLAVGEITIDSLTTVVYRGTADIAVDDYTAATTGPDTVTVTDDYGDPGNDQDLGMVTFDQHDAFEYTTDFTCPSDLDEYTDGVHTIDVTNTAKITETGDEATANVEVTCYILDVAKTAIPAFDRDFNWQVSKLVSIDDGDFVEEGSVDVIDGAPVHLEWKISVTKSDPIDTGHRVSGTITVSNPAPMDAEDVVVTDQITAGIDATVDCDGDNIVTIPAESQVQCSYETDLPDNASRINTATAAFADLTFTGIADVNFGRVAPTNVTDNSAVVSDRLFETFTITENWESGVGSLPEPASCGENVNTVTVTPSDSSAITDTATATVNCLAPTVDKTVATSFTRKYLWALTKTGVDADGVPIGPDGLRLAQGQHYDLVWKITATLADPAYVDSNWAVSGVITVNNPAPDALDFTVTDSLTLGGADVAVAIDCGDGPGDTQITVAAQSSGECTYVAAATSDAAGNNTATATYKPDPSGQDRSVSSDAKAVDFASAHVTFVDATVDVYDVAPDPDVHLGSASVGALPAMFTHTTPLGAHNLVCGANLIYNKAVIVNDQQVELTYAEDTVTVNVECGKGCTLTQGYWKTHNPQFWAAHNGNGPPEDDTWYELGPGGAGELFPYGDTGLTYYQIMATPTGGDPWMQLAHQYIAAKLNILNGADPSALAYPGSYPTYIEYAEYLLDTYDPGSRGRTARDVRRLLGPVASLFANYNEGLIGPGHCDEDANSKL